MDFDDDPLDLLDDDGDGVNEMCLFFDKDSDKQQPSKSPQGTGCAVVLFCLGTGAISAGMFLSRLI